MEIIDLTPENESLYFVCLEDWSDEMREAGNHKEQWYRSMQGRGLRVKLAKDDGGEIGGMIQYLPVELSPADGHDLYFVLCIWVHGYKEGRGDFRKQGMGSALLEAAENDTRERGKKGLVVWGVTLPFFIRAAWFKKHGYSPVDRMGIQQLLWKPFSEGAEAPRWIREKKRPEKEKGCVSVCAFFSGWCPAQNIVFERAKRACTLIGGNVEFTPYHTYEKSIYEEWGISDGLFIDGKKIRTGPPPSYKKIEGIIKKRLRKYAGARIAGK